MFCYVVSQTRIDGHLQPCLVVDLLRDGDISDPSASLIMLERSINMIHPAFYTINNLIGSTALLNSENGEIAAYRVKANYGTKEGHQLVLFLSDDQSKTGDLKGGAPQRT